MKTTLRLALCSLALAAPGAALRASEPAAPCSRVVVLENDRTLEGDVEQVANQYRIRQSAGETWVPADKVRKVCKNADEAYQFLRTTANLADPDEHLRLSQWCRLHDLPAQSLAEVRAAVALRPEHEPTRRLLAHLEKGSSTPAATPAAAPAPREKPSYQSAPPVDLTTESLSQYITRVQPILMNACASCHGPNHPGTFHLTRVYEIGNAQHRVTQQNAAEVVRQINRERPQLSPLLTKAVTVHGSMTQPPLPGRDGPAYQALDEWVQRTLASNPQLNDHATVASAEPRLLEIKDARPLPATGQFASAQEGVAPPMPATSVVQTVSQIPVPGGLPGGVLTVAGSAPPPPRTVEAPPAPPAAPVDEFDPVLFNGQMHPGGKK